jgi:hypothetical protein
MATRSAIGILREDGSINAVYCHWDGYIDDGVGQTLFENYNSTSKVEDLIFLGNISSLGEEIGEKHDFDKRVKNWTTFYGRDRGEEYQEAKKFLHKLDFHQHFNWSDYYYLYDEAESKWLYKSSGAKEYRKLETHFDREFA